MDTFANWFEVMWKMALPVGGLSFFMVWWSLKNGMLTQTEDVDALKKEIQEFGKRHKDKKQQSPKVNPIHDKWLKFGGGFYGIVALYTYGLIEFQEIRDLIANYGGIPPFLQALDVQLIINMFINALKNFIGAITWPVYWMSEFGSRNMWVWMLVVYASYWIGMKVAQMQFSGTDNGDSGNANSPEDQDS